MSNNLIKKHFSTFRHLCYSPLFAREDSTDEIIFAADLGEFKLEVKTGIHPHLQEFSRKTGSFKVFQKNLRREIKSFAYLWMTFDLGNASGFSEIVRELTKQVDDNLLLLSGQKKCRNCEVGLKLIIPRNEEQTPFWVHQEIGGAVPVCQPNLRLPLHLSVARSSAQTQRTIKSKYFNANRRRRPPATIVPK